MTALVFHFNYTNTPTPGYRLCVCVVVVSDLLVTCDEIYFFTTPCGLCRGQSVTRMLNEHGGGGLICFVGIQGRTSLGLFIKVYSF